MFEETNYVKYILLLFLAFSAFAQNTNISVVSAEKVNVIYRGVPNPIKIAVPGAKSFTATAPGLKALDSIGNYKLSPGAGKEVIVTIEAVMEDGSQLKEEKVFRIKGLPAPAATLYGNEGYMKLTKQELIDAVVKVEVSSFTLILPNGNKIIVDGNEMNKKAIKAIKKLKNKQEVTIDYIKYNSNFYRFPAKPMIPIIVEITNSKQ